MERVRSTRRFIMSNTRPGVPLTVIQLPDVLPQIFSTDASVALHVHEIAQRQDDFLNRAIENLSRNNTGNMTYSALA